MFILRRSEVANFTDIVKIETIFIQTTFKGSKKFKKFEIINENEIFMCII